MTNISKKEVVKTFKKANWSQYSIKKIEKVNTHKRDELIDLLYTDFSNEPYTPNKGILDHYIIRCIEALK